MGLDMYLYKKDSQANKIDVAAYWRKANAIHGFFVTHIQDGEDNCKEHLVKKEHFETLKEKIEEIFDKLNVLNLEIDFSDYNENNKFQDLIKKAKEEQYDEYEELMDCCELIMPTQCGFFFGSISYDFYYFSYLKYTLTVINNILKSYEKDEYYYCSSW